MENLTARYGVTLPAPRPFATAIAAINAVTVILTFTTASQ
jgi:hypothetical protein